MTSTQQHLAPMCVSRKGVGKSIPFRLIDQGDTQWRFSDRQRTSALTYYFVIRVEDTSEWGVPEGGDKYHGTLYVVSPDYAGPGPVRRAIAQYEGMDGIEVPTDRDMLIEMLVDQGGLGAPIVQYGGNNKAAVLKKLAVEATMATSLFGFYLDRYTNRMGTTGWDCLQGKLGGGMDRKGQAVDDDRAAAECIVAHALAGVNFDLLEEKHRMGDEELRDYDEVYVQLEYWGRLLVRRWDAEMPRSWQKRK